MNQAQFISTINQQKEAAFIQMCNTLLNLAGIKVKIRNFDHLIEFGKNKESAIIALLRKCHNIIYNVGSPVSLIPFLTRVATKEKKQTQPGWTHSPGEFLGVCSFRWDWKGYTLTEVEKIALRKYLNIKAPAPKAKKVKAKKAEPIILLNVDDYQGQANKFAKDHGVKLTVKSVEYRPYFPKDKESRYVFKMQLKRAGKQYTFNFGQSIAVGDKEPTMYDVLASIQKYDVGSFENFCGDFGYNQDSRTAERTYKAVCKEFENVEKLFGDVIEELQEIQ